MRDGINTICQWCKSGVRVVSVQQIDLSGTVGHLVAGVLNRIAAIQGTTKTKPERAKALKAQGLKEKEIASALGVTERTVFRYLAEIS